MKDGYGRKINYLRLSVTDRCNFRCKYCVDEICHSVANKELPLDKMLKISEVAVSCGIEKIRITGGEPLIREGIVEFCKKLSFIDGLNELTMTTNGCFLKDYAKSLKDAGVSRLNISLDTLDKEKFESMAGVDKFDEVLAGIYAAINAGFKQIKINVVLIGDFNTDEITSFVNLTKDNNVSIRFIELMPVGACRSWDNKRFVSDDIVLKTVPQLKHIYSDGVAQIYKIDGYKGTAGLIRPMSKKFCDVCNRVRITADGKLKTCLHSSDEYDLSALNEQQLVRCLKNAIMNKPLSHNLSLYCHSNTNRSMNQIGG